MPPASCTRSSNPRAGLRCAYELTKRRSSGSRRRRMLSAFEASVYGLGPRGGGSGGGGGVRGGGGGGKPRGQGHLGLRSGGNLKVKRRGAGQLPSQDWAGILDHKGARAES